MRPFAAGRSFFRSRIVPERPGRNAGRIIMKTPTILSFIALSLLCTPHQGAFAQTPEQASHTHIEAAEAALAGHHPDDALREFRAAAQLTPSSFEAHAGVGTLEWMRGDCGAAIPELRSAIALRPAETRIEGILGVCEKRSGDASAETHLRQAFAQQQDARMRLEFGVELGDLYDQRGDIDHALPIVRELVSLAPENPDILFFAQHLYQQMADETMNKLALLVPDSARMQQVIAERLINAGDLRAAAEHYRSAIRLDPHLPGAHFELAQALVETAPNDAAAQRAGEAELDQALRIDGDSPRIECALGRIAYLENNLDVALLHYQRAYAMNSHELAAQMGAGRTLMAEHEPGQALHYLAEAVAQDPLNAEAHYHYARALKSLQKNDEAQQELARYETVRKVQARVRDLYRQMNKRADTASSDLPVESPGSQP